MKCPQCGSDHTFAEGTGRRREPGRAIIFNWRRCNACQHSFPDQSTSDRVPVETVPLGPKPLGTMVLRGCPTDREKLHAEHARVVAEALRLADSIDAHAAEVRHCPDDFLYPRGHLDNLLRDSKKLESLMHEEAAIRRALLGKGPDLKRPAVKDSRTLGTQAKAGVEYVHECKECGASRTSKHPQRQNCYKCGGRWLQIRFVRGPS